MNCAVGCYPFGDEVRTAGPFSLNFIKEVDGKEVYQCSGECGKCWFYQNNEYSEEALVRSLIGRFAKIGDTSTVMQLLVEYETIKNSINRRYHEQR